MTHVRFARVCQFYRQLTLQLIRGYHISLGGTIFQSRYTSFSRILYVNNVLEKTENWRIRNNLGRNIFTGDSNTTFYPVNITWRFKCRIDQSHFKTHLLSEGSNLNIFLFDLLNSWGVWGSLIFGAGFRFESDETTLEITNK